MFLTKNVKYIIQHLPPKNKQPTSFIFFFMILLLFSLFLTFENLLLSYYCWTGAHCDKSLLLIAIFQFMEGKENKLNRSSKE
jgi:hypothetical protein